MSVSLRSVVVALAFVASVTVASAQTAQKPSATPSHLQAARELVVTSGLQRSFSNIIPDLMVQLYRNFSVTRPELAKDLKAVVEGNQDEFLAWDQEIIDVAANVYVQLMSEQECKDAVAFFKSPIGKKFVEVQPTIFLNVGPVVDQWSKSVSARMLERVRVEMKKKGHDF